MDRRRLEEKIVKLEKQLKDVEKTRELHRKTRRRAPYPTVALVGYTNAGKSTLFNKLTGAEVLAKDLLFATLDPSMRLLRLPSGRKVILSDTVGFISDLPTSLVAAFRSTLEEVLEARIILRVEDRSHEEAAIQRQDVQEVLTSLGVDAARQDLLFVFNKMDKLDAGQQAQLAETAKEEGAFCISALTGHGLKELLEACDAILRQEAQLFVLHMTPNGEALSWLHDNGEVESVEVEPEREDTYIVKVFLTAEKEAKFQKLYSTVQIQKVEG